MNHRNIAAADTSVKSPLDFAVYERTRNALNMARTALDTGNARLAFQPVVTARGSHKAVFYEA
ncbi:MAG: EAL domain-containing protein, partial [Pseudomonadota bacterium]